MKKEIIMTKNSQPNYQFAVVELKDFIKNIYETTYEKLSPNISRGHLRSISTDIEDGILFLFRKYYQIIKSF